MSELSVDAYSPKEIASRMENAGVIKSTGESLRIFALSILAGAFIAFGALLYTIVTYDSGDIAAGLLRLIGGLSFCLGLILVIVAGAELFTGNNLIVMAYVDGKVSFAHLMQNWAIVYIGNFVGALAIMVLIYFSGHWFIDSGAVGAKTIAIANAKVNLTWMEAFSRGILCNILVCLAVWLSFAGHSVVDKVIAILFPVTAFVALGFEHSVANMYFIPAGLLAQQQAELAQVVSSMNLENLTTTAFIFDNLVPVTLGNIVGGSFFVGVVYWFIYLRK
jgi:formate transporter